MNIFKACTSLINYLFLVLQEYAESAMNELLGWYGYDGSGGDAERCIELTKTSLKNKCRSTVSLNNSSMTSINSNLTLPDRRKSSSTDDQDGSTSDPDSSKETHNKLNSKPGAYKMRNKLINTLES